nr:hypothetical protein [Tanacetum cinerariifolium]
MSDTIPFDLQIEIIKKVSDVKSLVRFRYICLVDDDNIKTFKVQKQQFVVSPLLKQYNVYNVVGTCLGLVCMLGFHYGYMERMLVIWNPSIGKSFGIVDPSYHSHTYNYGFGVCPGTKGPTVVNIIRTDNKPWHVEVFTLSSRVWNVIPNTNLLHKTIRINRKTQVVMDRFIYWGACEEIIKDDECCDVWVMERDASFKKLFTIGAPLYYILGFRKSGEPILKTVKELGESSVDVYDPSSEQIKNLEIYREKGLYFMDSYKQSLLLLDHSDSLKIVYEHIIAIKGWNVDGKSGAAMTDEACQCKGTRVLNVRFGEFAKGDTDGIPMMIYVNEMPIYRLQI